MSSVSSMSSNPSNPSSPSNPSIPSLSSGTTSSQTIPALSAASTRVFHRRELVQLLSGSLGTEKAQALVMEAAMSLQLSTIEMNLEQAQKLFNHLATQPGIVGITAGLAKVRLGRLAKVAA